MNTLKTIQLRLEPDQDFPMFQRLCWEKVDVSIRDVLTQGIHPWFDAPNGYDRCPSLTEGVLQRINAAPIMLSALKDFGYSYEMVLPNHVYYYHGSMTKFEQFMDTIHKDVFFVEDLDYRRLLEIARTRLQATWNNIVAHELTKRVYYGFQEIRKFLKSVDKSIKLSSYEDLDRCNLADILSIDDFPGHENLLIEQALTARNFRKSAFLGHITNAQGRLRLKPSIDHLTLELVPRGMDYEQLKWRVQREGELWRFYPELGNSASKRIKAKAFADQWRRDEGKLCFSTGLDELALMVEEEVVRPSFPSLDYTLDRKGAKAFAELKYSAVPAYGINVLPNSKWTGEQLKHLLSNHGMSMTGNKATLVKKVAKVAANEYLAQKTRFDTYFDETQYIIIAASQSKRYEGFPGLSQDDPIDRLALAMYILNHLRGNAIIDVAHHNNTYTEEQLAHALLTGKVCLSGAFLKAA